MTQLHIFIGGYVQSVGYRRFVRDLARKRNISGWVRNLKDGRVEAVLQGKRESINEIIKLCKKGPFMSDVKSLNVFWEDADEDYTEFKILETV